MCGDEVCVRGGGERGRGGSGTELFKELYKECSDLCGTELLHREFADRYEGR